MRAVEPSVASGWIIELRAQIQNTPSAIDATAMRTAAACPSRAAAAADMRLAKATPKSDIDSRIPTANTTIRTSSVASGAAPTRVAERREHGQRAEAADREGGADDRRQVRVRRLERVAFGAADVQCQCAAGSSPCA